MGTEYSVRSMIVASFSMPVIQYSVVVPNRLSLSPPRLGSNWSAYYYYKGRVPRFQVVMCSVLPRVDCELSFIDGREA